MAVNQRKNSSRKSNKKFTEEEKQQKQQILGGFIIIISVLFFVSLISEQMGYLGELTKNIFYLLFGKGSYGFCFLLLFIGLSYIARNPSKVKWKYLFFAISSFISSLILFNMQSSSDYSWEKRLSILGSKPIDGGAIGAVIGNIFLKLLGKVGTGILIFLIFFLSLVWVLTSEQKKKLIIFIGSIIKSIKEKKGSIKNSSIKATSHKINDKSKNNVKKNIEIIDMRSEVDSFEPEIIDYRPEDTPLVKNKEQSKVKKEKTSPLENDEKIAYEKEIHASLSDEDYVFPDINLLKNIQSSNSKNTDFVRNNAKIIEETMDNFNIDCRVTAINHGPSITCYELQPAPGVRLNRIVALADNLSLSLASSDIRIEAPIPGKSAVGIEVPNKNKDSVGLREIIESMEFIKNESSVPLTLGKDVSGKNIISSIDKMPHLLIAGATGSGKSVCINTILISILYKSKPSEVKLILIDPKVVELGVYNEIPHLLIPVVTDPKKAAFALSWAVDEMEKRYKKFAGEGVRDIKGFNHKVEEGLIDDNKMSKIVIVVDELSDLMMVAAKEVEDYITRLAQMARAAGLHLILATQRPSVDVITGTIKANIPSRIAFSVSSQIDSRTILDMAGAEKLLGKGDMLFYPSSYPKPKRLQGAFVSDEEVESVLKFIKENSKVQEYHEDAIEAVETKLSEDLIDQDPLLDDAIEIVITQEQASISFIQRKLKVGYSRAARIVDQMEEIGIIGPHEGSKPRKLLLSEEEIKSYLEKEENS